MALRSKAHWGYDEAFMQQVADELTVTPEMVRRCDVMVAERAVDCLDFISSRDDRLLESCRLCLSNRL
jgi:hypothetical protein